MTRVGGAAAVVAAVGLLAGCGAGSGGESGATSSTSTQGAMEAATSACSSTPRDLLSADRKSITVDTKGTKDFNGEDMEDVRCFLRELGAPDYVDEHIGSTRALDGQQTDEWEGVEARWTYHPDDGLEITFIDRS